MDYNMTAERTLRIAVSFQADDDEDAVKKAAELFADMVAHPVEFDGGDTEHDYALCGDDGRTVIDWR